MIAFERCDGPECQVYIVRPDGSSQRVLLADGHEPAWSPEGRRVAFEHPPPSGYLRAVAVGTVDRRSNLVPPTDVVVVNGYEPAWSPDGKQIAFSRVVGHLFNSDIYVIDVDGGSLRRLTEDPDSANRRPTWSPDGKRIAYQNKLGSSEGRIWVMNADGGDQHVLPVEGDSLAWSPDGTWIAFESAYGEGIALVREDGKELRRLGVFGFSPAWSPDGRWIAYVTHKIGTVEPYDLYVMRSNGSGIRRIARNAEHPAWQPR